MNEINNKLPEKIKVKIMRHKSGVGFFAELPEYGIFTEAESELELHEMINDLIYELFSIPKNLQNKVRYVPSAKQSLPEKINSLLMMGTPELFRQTTYAS